MARFIMAGRIQAFSFLMLFSIIGLFLPLLSLFANAAIALVTLRKGWQSGLYLSIAGAATLSLLPLALSGGEGSLADGFLLGLLQWLPVVLFAAVLHYSVSWKLTLESIFLLTSIGVLLFHIFVPEPGSFWSAILEKNVKPALEASNNPDLDIQKWLSTASYWMTAFVALLMSMSWSLSMLLARFWQAQLYNPGGFGEEFRTIRLGKPAASAVLLLMGVTAFTQHSVAIELLVCGLAVFLFQGISLLHAVVKQRELHRTLLVIFYVLFIMLPVHIALLVVAFGIIDSFADFRAKLIKK